MTTAPTPLGISRSLLIGALASLAVILTLSDPGITVDEPLDVRPGRTYVATLRARGLGFFEPNTVTAVFRDNAEHPPLGRWLLGIASTLGEPFEVLIRGGPDPVGIYTVAGRLAPAIVFGCLVTLVARTAGRWGRASGYAAGFSLAVMPRVFAHAHLGALDTFIAFFWTLALLRAERATSGPRPVVSLALAGVFWGLALLTKIHAWFLPPVVLLLALVKLPTRQALLGMSLWTVVGLAVFFAGWPWLWYDPVGRLAAYLGTGVTRLSIQVLYFGTTYADRDVPWHYPWVYAATTVPVGLLGLGIWGAILGLRKREGLVVLLLGAIFLFLGIFSTRVPVYDGERLFLVIFPLGAIVVGRGFQSIWEAGSNGGRRLLGIFLLAQAFGLLATHPFGLSYYNALIGGLPGAERLGMELTYWGDAVDDRLLNRLARDARPGESASLAPTLAPEQGKIATNRALARLPLVLQDQDGAGRTDWLVVSRREAYWSAAVRERLARDEVVAERARQGVWLSRLLRRRKSDSP